jgi:hypothetical protein
VLESRVVSPCTRGTRERGILRVARAAFSATCLREKSRCESAEPTLSQRRRASGFSRIFCVTCGCSHFITCSASSPTPSLRLESMGKELFSLVNKSQLPALAWSQLRRLDFAWEGGKALRKSRRRNCAMSLSRSRDLTQQRKVRRLIALQRRLKFGWCVRSCHVFRLAALSRRARNTCIVSRFVVARFLVVE